MPNLNEQTELPADLRPTEIADAETIARLERRYVEKIEAAEAARRQHGSAAQAGDFAKIVRGSNGQQVLFYKECDPDDGNILHSVVNYDGYQADMKISGLPDEGFAVVLDKCDEAMADKVLAQTEGFGL